MCANSHNKDAEVNKPNRIGKIIEYVCSLKEWILYTLQKSKKTLIYILNDKTNLNVAKSKPKVSLTFQKAKIFCDTIPLHITTIVMRRKKSDPWAQHTKLISKAATKSKE